MSTANYKPLNLEDDVLSRLQSNIQQAFSNVDQSKSIKVTTVISQYQVTVDDDVILADPTRGAFLILLPDPKTMTTKAISIAKTGGSSNAVTVQPMSPTVLIGGSAKLTLPLDGRIVTDGVNYSVVP